MADVERVTIKREEGTSGRSGGYTVIGLILGVLIVAGVAVAIIGYPQIQQWWNTDSHGRPDSVTSTTTP